MIVSSKDVNEDVGMQSRHTYHNMFESVFKFVQKSVYLHVVTDEGVLYNTMVTRQT